MKHPHIPTFHVHRVPDVVFDRVRALAELAYDFGCGCAGYASREVLEAARKHLPALQPHEALQSLMASKVVLAHGVLEEVALRKSHLIVVLHHHRDPLYGWRMLIPQENQPLLHTLLSEMGLQLVAAPSPHTE